ncbi:hypothetical protein EVAR_26601_1 [Eumeta japonica]|uniref:Uncharacterized protein n=1 Tax=Eumeta variegata TaxID=151549 RepID=A0A4C1XIP0_EUMVA|nr:hypothetical protein EVAR_26601_1 [Eumeta japonica]
MRPEEKNIFICIKPNVDNAKTVQRFIIADFGNVTAIARGAHASRVQQKWGCGERTRRWSRDKARRHCSWLITDCYHGRNPNERAGILGKYFIPEITGAGAAPSDQRGIRGTLSKKPPQGDRGQHQYRHLNVEQNRGQNRERVLDRRQSLLNINYAQCSVYETSDRTTWTLSFPRQPSIGWELLAAHITKVMTKSGTRRNHETGGF